MLQTCLLSLTDRVRSSRANRRTLIVGPMPQGYTTGHHP